MILAFFTSYDLAGALTLCRHCVIMSSILLTLLTYYATFFPETGLKPIMLDWPDQKLIEKCKHQSGEPGAFGTGLHM